MTDSLHHRGPDDSGYYFNDFVGLGHRRLAIIDLETGRQPMSNEDGTVWIVFNGEIYNAPDLRPDLESAGHQFRTRSDTEVIIHAYEQHGPDCVEALNGMFAFAIWDQRIQRLMLARDRVGIKPLYYSARDGDFIFASELKAILAYGWGTPELDLTSLNQYLTYEYVPTPRTIFAGIKKLPPATFLLAGEDGDQSRTYWNPAFNTSDQGVTRQEERQHVEDLKITLREAVRKELLSDVPVGVLLSGGLDSSAIAAMMAQLEGSPVKSFSIGFEDPSFDESNHARAVAEHLGLEHHELTLTPRTMLDLAPKIAEILDEPFGDSSIVPTYLLSRFTREHVKVALGGDGGDELFAGYSTLQAHRISHLYERYVPQIIRNRLIPRAVNTLPVSFDNISLDFKARRFLAGQSSEPVVRHHTWLGSFTLAQRQRLLGPLAQERCARELAYEHLAACPAHDVIDRIMYCDMKLYLEGDILPKVDRASMANSLEVRVPLLNALLLDHVAQLPQNLKLRGLTTKYILRKALDGLVPESIRKRGKKGFNMPVAKWLIGPLKELALDMLSPAGLRRQGLFNGEYVQELMNEHFTRTRDNRKLLWTLLVFQLWYDTWASGHWRQ